MKILIIRTDRMGDMVLTLPMAAAVKRINPATSVSLLARRYTEPFARMCPDVDEVILAEDTDTVHSLAKKIKASKVDAIFIPSPKPKLALAAFLSRVRIRVGTGYRWYSFLFSKKIYSHRKNAAMNEAEYNVEMLKVIGIESETPLPNLIINDVPISLPSKYAVLHIRTGGSSPAWETEKFISLSQTFTNLGCKIVLTGENNDREFLFTVSQKLKQAGASVHILTQMTPEELAVVLQRAEFVIAGSTGPGHLAAALGTKTIGLFPLAKALSKERWGFRGMQVINLAPKTNLKQESSNSMESEGVTAITPSDVIQAIEQLGRRSQ